jgi:23S rRNA pseudouridine1911/1915/1917 synthase
MTGTLHDWLRKQYPQAKQNTLRKMIQDGRVWLNGIAAHRINLPISETDTVEVRDREKKQPAEPASVHPMRIVFEDEDLLVIEKPCGLLTSTVPREKRPTALAILRQYVADTDPDAELGLIHRLDRDASGLLVFSKNEPAYESLKEQFFKHTVQRTYLAITHGVPTPLVDRIKSSLVELPDGYVRSTKRPGGGQKAVTDYETIGRGNGMAAVRVTLQTGRKHQIRAHLSERGVPIVGDRMYGKPDTAPRLLLAAVLLGFEHPRTGEKMLFEAPVPLQFPKLPSA